MTLCPHGEPRFCRSCMGTPRPLPRPSSGAGTAETHYAGGWRRGTRAAAEEVQRLARLTDVELAAEQGPDADQERAARQREATCDHRPTRIGRSTAERCSKCGAMRLPAVPEMAPAVPAPAPAASAGAALGQGDGPFSFDAVRDLLGLVRAIYAAERGPVMRARAAQIGEDLVAALDLAASSSPDRAGERVAWARAAKATMASGDLVGVTTLLEPIVRAACQRVRRRA